MTNKCDFKITGMSCSSCVNKIEKEVKLIPGVISISINLINESGIVQTENSNIIHDVERKITELGYKVKFDSAYIPIKISTEESSDSSRQKEDYTNTNIFKFNLKIKGMTCSYCSNKVEQVVREISGVVFVNVNLITENALISVKNRNTIEQVKEKILSLCYTIPGISEESNSDENIRQIILENSNYEAIRSVLQDKDGILGFSSDQTDLYTQISYDSRIIYGYQIIELINSKLSLANSVKYINLMNFNISQLTSFKESISDFKIILCFVLSVLLMLFTMVFHKIDLTRHIAMTLSEIYLFSNISIYLCIELGLSITIIVIYGIGIYSESIRVFAKFRVLNMKTLITIGSLSAILLTLMNLINLIFISETKEKIEKHSMNSGHSSEAAAIVISIFILGKWVEERAKKNIRNQSSKIFSQERLKLGSEVLWMKPSNKSFDILEQKNLDVGLLEKNDFVIIDKKCFLLFDSIIVNGSITVNENSIFGFDNIVELKIGDRIKSGTEIHSGRCIVQVEEVLEKSMLYKITIEMGQALNQKLKFQHFIDKIIDYFVPIVVSSSILALIVWSLIKLLSEPIDYLTWTFVFERSISILVVSCPCAFGLAIPTVTTIALNKALQYGILIKNLSALTEIKNTEKMVFDKTGTLTKITKDVELFYESDFSKELPLWKIIAESEKEINHPVAYAIYSYAMSKLQEKNKLNQKSYNLENVSEIKSTGKGIHAKIKLKKENNFFEFDLLLGNEDFIKSKGDFNLNENIVKQLKSTHRSKIYVQINKEVISVLTLNSSSEIRENAKSIMDILKQSGKDLYILSGDEISSVHEVGKTLEFNLEKCIGGVDNKSKKNFLRDLKTKGLVLMIGDGVNDILSISEADYGISFNANSQLNMIASDVIFIKEDLSLILSLLKLSKLTYVFIWINIFWAFSYNLIMLPVTAGVFHSFWKIELSPTLSSFSMLCSSLLIIFTSNVLRLFSLDSLNVSNSTKTYYLEENMVSNPSIIVETIELDQSKAKTKIKNGVKYSQL